MTKQFINKITGTEQLTKDIYAITVESEEISVNAIPGQFVNIKCGEGTHALLRRPISICSTDKNAQTYRIVFQNKGIGTGILSCRKPGDTLDILGPLGNGFDLDPIYKNIAVIGGGIGVFPLLFLLKESKAIIKRTYLGFQTKQMVVLEDEFRSYSSTISIATDDGSYGIQGFPTDILARDLLADRADMIYACGPKAMLEKVAAIAEQTGINCQISLEERMGCGFGACLTCACKTRSHMEDWQYSHVCKDGPVFNGKDIIFE